MLEQTAEVVRSAADGIWVRAVEPSGCGTCGGQGCASRRIAELFQRKPRQFLVDCDLSLSPGDRVVIGIPRGSVLKSAARAYGLPLGLMLAGALLVQAIVPGDGPALAGLLVGGGVAWLLARGGRAARPLVLRRESDNTIHMRKG
jgi:sigma-E factor negative regulatory protein RseC